MRVSKVKVSVEVNRRKEDRMVLMKRTSAEGSLIYDDKTGKTDGKDRTKDILPEKKKSSFELSIQNQTIPKLEIVKRDLGRDFNKNIYSSLTAIIKTALTGKFTGIGDYLKLKGITEELIKQYLSHRFQQETFNYYCDGKRLTFNLVQLLIESIKQKSVAPMAPYRDWVNWYIQDKSEKLTKSIKNNHIAIDTETQAAEEEHPSPRKQALLMWEDEFVRHNLEPELIDLCDMHALYQTDCLMEKLREVPYTNDEKGVCEVNEYHRKLKAVLQEHQKVIFGKRENPNEENRRNVQLYTYNVEVVKYLEHYFPIKKSKRRFNVESINYYLSTDKVKQTIRMQIENAVRSNLIRQGKYAHHGLDANTVSSASLSEIKADEGFSFNMITQCAFAANNLRNIIDPGQTEDILGKNTFKESLKSDYRIAQADVFPSFFNFTEEEHKRIGQDYVTHLWAIRGAVEQIRNNVVHYKKDSLDVIFNIKQFGLEGRDDYRSYKDDTLFGTLLQREKEKAPDALALQLMTGNVLEYYPMETLKTFFADKTFSLYRSVVPFAPGFKKVMSGGGNYQNADKAQYYNLGISFYLPKESFDKEAWNARYSFLKLIYNNLFLPKFTSDTSWFRRIANDVLRINVAENQKKARYANQKIYKIAFADIRRMEHDESIASYMAYVQSYFMMEVSKKAESKNKEEPRLNFEKFLLQTFIKGFNDYLNLQDSFEFIQHPAIQFEHEETCKANKRNQWMEEIKTVIKLSDSDIDSTDNAHISFFVFCKLLDAIHLSDLRNELIKYYQSQSYRPGETKKIKHLFAIIELCLLSVDTNFIRQQKQENKSLVKNELTPFLEEGRIITDYGDLYTQSDDETLVIHRTIEKGYKYGTHRVLEEVIKTSPKYRIAVSEWDEWNDKKQLVESWIKDREQLHKDWVESTADNQKKKSLFTSEMAQQYVEKCHEIDRYNWLDNKLHLQHINRLHALIIDVLGRMAGFTAIFERDFQYYCNNNSKINSLLQSGDQMPFDFSRSLPRFTSDQSTILFNTMLSTNYKEIRNYIAHFNYLNAFEDERGKTLRSYSLVELINGLRDLFGYDRKLKNAVSKAFIKLFEKHGMILKFEIATDSHQLKVASIVPRSIKHLGKYKINKRSIETDMVEKEFCNMCRSLLELKRS